MSFSSHDLRLHQELLLIALRDDTGTPESRAGMVDIALGGAILSELVIEGCVSIAEGKKPLVDLVAAKPLDDAVLDECVDLVAAAKRRRRAADWVSRFARLGRLRPRVAEGLCRRGILEDSEARVLLLFKRKAFPEIDPEPERRLVGRLREALESDGDLDPRTGMLLALAHATGMLRVHFDKATLKRRQQRLERIAEGDAIAGAAREAVRAAQAAVVAATTAAMIATTTSATH